MNKAYKYRLYPDKAQREYFSVCFSATRFIWNKMLYDRMEYYKETGKSKTFTPAGYKSANPWLKEADSLALANVQLDLDRSYRAFFSESSHNYTDKAIAKAKRQGRELSFYDLEKHPKFKSKKDDAWRSYTTNNQNGTVAMSDKHVRLPKIGLVRCRVHRAVPDGCTIKSATVSRSDSGKYFVSVLVECGSPVAAVASETAIGLDYSMRELYVDHEGRCPDYRRFFRASEEKLARAQRKLSGMEKGSNNYRKQKTQIAKIHEKIANQRRDFLHKESDSITKGHDVVCVEDLDMKAMAQSHNYGKSVSDNGWGMFTRFMEYKQGWKGHYFVKVERLFPSSKLCHVCGWKKDGLALSDREWDCEQCGTHHLRDINAARNIRARGLEILSAHLARQ